MASLNDILQRVGDELGEQGGGYWQSEELTRWTEFALTRHAREALSVPAEVRTTTLPGVQEYQLPDDFGELIDARICTQYSETAEPLLYIDRQTLLTRQGPLVSVGDPECFYIFQDKMGLYPVPSRDPFYERFSEETTEYRVGVSNTYASTFYESPHTLALANPSDGPRVEISHVGLYLKREGLPYPGQIQLWLTPMTAEGDSVSAQTLKSYPVEAVHVGVQPEWVLFDFTRAPLTLLEEPVNWQFLLYADTTYRAAMEAEFQGPGVQVGVDPSSGDAAWIQLHRMLNDLEIDYYRNTCPKVRNPDDTLDLPFYPPARYHPTIVDMVLAKAMRKGQYNMAAANDYEARAHRDIMYARAQATLRTRGDIQRVSQRTRFRHRQGFYVDYRGGKFTGRAF